MESGETAVRYELGNIDRYSVAMNGTVMENASFFSLKLASEVDAERLGRAVCAALCHHPLFRTRVRYRKWYYLEQNDSPVLLTRASVSDRPKQFGASTNGYPWRLCYYGAGLCFEWCHVVTDGKGALAFLSTILEEYFGIQHGEAPGTFALEPGFESFYDASVKPIGQKKQPAGFAPGALPGIRNGYKCTSHLLAIETAKLLAVAKKTDSTPAAILAPLFSKAIRQRLPLNAKNRNVSCGIVVDCRKPMSFQTMHNFILNKVITYTDRMDQMEFSTVCTVYRSILDLFTQPENIISGCTNMIRQTDALYRLRPRRLQRFVMKIVARAVKNRMNNIGLSYLGKAPFCDAVLNEILAFDFKSWPDIGNCVLAVIDLKGTLYVDICENYRDTQVVGAFLRVCKDIGIEAREVETTQFEQAGMILTR